MNLPLSLGVSAYKYHIINTKWKGRGESESESESESENWYPNTIDENANGKLLTVARGEETNKTETDRPRDSCCVNYLAGPGCG